MWLAVAGGGDPGAAGLLVLGAGATALTARLVTLAHDWLVPALVVAGAALLAVVAPGLTDHLRGPIGYANATATFYVLAAAAALIVVARAPEPAVRYGAGALAAAFAAVPLLNRSIAGVLLAGLLPLALLAQGRRDRVRVLIAAGAVGVVVVLVVTVGAALDYRPAGRSGGLAVATASLLSERRVSLWSEALAIMGEHPLQGAGIGSFERLSPTALADRDARWAHHEYLQVGAEAGVPGLLAAVVLVGWGYARLWHGPLDGGTAAAAAGLTAAAAHATIDYVWHFAAVVLVAAALVGAGSARTSSASRGSPGSRRLRR